MAYWIVKSDPDEYSFHDLLRDHTTQWTGVRNYAARLHLRAMAKGDTVLMYHSTSEKAIIGVCSVTKSAYPDPTATSGDWVAVDLGSPQLLNNIVTLAAMKDVSSLQNVGLIRIGRLSVMPLEEHEFNTIMNMTSA